MAKRDRKPNQKTAEPKAASKKTKGSKPTKSSAADPAQRGADTDALVAGLTQRLARAEARAQRWKAEAKRLRTEAEAARGVVAEAPKAAEDSAPEPVTAPEPVEKPAPRPAPTVTSGDSSPGPSWTVSALREEARRRGLSGHSRSSKAELLTLLDG